MGTVIWSVVMFPMAAFFTGFGIYAWKRKKPMWFRSGSTVREDEISDVPAYNRANGIMWIAFSAVFWIGAVTGLLQMDAAGWVVGVGTIAGVPVLALVWRRIYKKYGTGK